MKMNTQICLIKMYDNFMLLYQYICFLIPSAKCSNNYLSFLPQAKKFLALRSVEGIELCVLDFVLIEYKPIFLLFQNTVHFA